VLAAPLAVIAYAPRRLAIATMHPCCRGSIASSARTTCRSFGRRDMESLNPWRTPSPDSSSSRSRSSARQLRQRMQPRGLEGPQRGISSAHCGCRTAVREAGLSHGQDDASAHGQFDVAPSGLVTNADSGCGEGWPQLPKVLEPPCSSQFFGPVFSIPWKRSFAAAFERRLGLMAGRHGEGVAGCAEISARGGSRFAGPQTRWTPSELALPPRHNQLEDHLKKRDDTGLKSVGGSR
jgi:hypothetical protein